MFLVRVLSVGKGSTITPRHHHPHQHRHRHHPPHQLHPDHPPQLHPRHHPPPHHPPQHPPPPHYHRLPGGWLIASRELLPWPGSTRKDPVKGTTRGKESCKHAYI